MMKKIFFCIFSLISLFCFNLQAEDSEIILNQNEISTIRGKHFVKPENFKEFTAAADLVLSLSPAVYANPENYSHSAPSPVVFPVGIGFLWPDYTFLAMEPTLSIFTMYHLWYDGQALPAEIENRTTSTICLMLNLPAVISLYPNEKSRFQFSAGTGIFMRFGILANGVHDSDSGYSGSAGSDKDKINEYFWSNARFLYLSAGFSWLYTFSSKIKAGPFINIYLPAGSIINGEGIQGMLIYTGLKLNF